MKIYIEHRIESEKDLPKDGEYIVHYKRQDRISVMDIKRSEGSEDAIEFETQYWLISFDWYLEPVEISDGAEEILIKHGFLVNTHKGDNEIIRKAFIEPVIAAMKEFAAQEVAKDRAEHLLLEVKTQPTDEDIEEWANAWDETTHHEPWVWSAIRYGIKIGAKAALSGEIKKKCQE